MERIDVSETGRFGDMVAAAQRGESVEITQNGKVVAHLITARAKLIGEVEALRASLPAEARAIDWGGAIREMRETS